MPRTCPFQRSQTTRTRGLQMKPRLSIFVLAISLEFGTGSSRAVADFIDIIDLGTLGGNGSAGLGINNSGQVVGNAFISGSYPPHAFLYSNGIMNDLGTLGGRESYGLAINNSGQVAGYSTTNSASHAFLYSN